LTTRGTDGRWSHSEVLTHRGCAIRSGMSDFEPTQADLHSVDASVAEGLHACIVVERRVDAVDTNCVDASVCENRCITSATSSVGKRVNEGGRLAKVVVFGVMGFTWALVSRSLMVKVRR
jgi:hypothetical protein